MGIGIILLLCRLPCWIDRIDSMEIKLTDKSHEKKLIDKFHEINRIGMYHIGIHHILSKPEVCTKAVVVIYP